MTGRRVRNRKKRGLMKIGFCLYLVSCLFAIVWLRAEVLNMEYQLGELDRTGRDLTRERKAVNAQRASFYSSNRIESVAVRKLGMTLKDRQNVFYVKPGMEAASYKASLK